MKLETAKTPWMMVLVQEDPCQSPRPAEAVRIAAGVGAWQQVVVLIYLQGPAVRLLDRDDEELVDGDVLALAWPVVSEFNHPVYVDSASPWLKTIGTPALNFQEISPANLQELISKCQAVLRF